MKKISSSSNSNVLENKRRRPRGGRSKGPPIPVAEPPDLTMAEIDAQLEAIDVPPREPDAQPEALGVPPREPTANLFDRSISRRRITLEFALETNIRRVLYRPFSISMLKELEETARLSRLLMQTAQKNKENT